MKIEATELIAAAHVSVLAAEMWKAAWEKYAKENGIHPEASSKAQTAWRESNPPSAFIPMAMKNLSDVALQIRRLAEASSQ